MADFDIGNILQMARQMQEQMTSVQQALAGKTVEGSAGGGMVTVTANGAREIVRVAIDPQVVDRQEIAMLQDLVVAACNLALRKAQELAQEELGKVTGGVPLPPGLF